MAKDMMVELSDREKAILRLASVGRKNGAIAADLGLSTQTVKNNMAAICKKLEVRGRTAAVMAAYKRGVIE